MQFLLLFIFIGFFGLIIENVESRRVFDSTHVIIFPKFYPRPHKVNHKFLPKFEYTVYYETTSTSPLPPPTTPSTTTTTTTTTTEIPSTEATVTPSSRDGSFDWFGALIVLCITTCAALTFFVIRRKCSSQSGTYKIPNANLIPKDYYVNFCKTDDDFIEIHARDLNGPSHIASLGNQNYEEGQTEETYL